MDVDKHLSEVESILSDQHDRTLTEESICEEDEHGVLNLQSELETSAFQYDRRLRESRGCHTDDLRWEDSMHCSTGILKLSVLDDYRGPGLEWKPMLAVYVPNGPATYEFEIGRAGDMFYLRAFSADKNCHRDRYVNVLQASFF